MKKHVRTKVRQTRSDMAAERPVHTTNNSKRELIATKAYELYEQRGRTDGHDVEDWLRAEAIINKPIE